MVVRRKITEREFWMYLFRFVPKDGNLFRICGNFSDVYPRSKVVLNAVFVVKIVQ